MWQRAIARRRLVQGLGASLLVFGSGTARAGTSCSPTTPDIQGPFYLAGAPRRRRLASREEPGERLVIRGTVLGDDCRTPLAGAVLDVWQADAQGEYHGAEARYRLRGLVRSNRRGRYAFSTIKPGAYRLGAGFRPAHIHFTITHPDFAPLTTQLYFAGDPYLPPNDACGAACNSDEADRVIVLRRSGRRGAVLRGTFDVVLRRR